MRRAKDLNGDADLRGGPRAGGDYACLTFTDPDEWFDIVATFVRDGLRGRTEVIRLTVSGYGGR